jgi:ABC-type Fe3+/spermidine/putrescine transport system ATPase subunit
VVVTVPGSAAPHLVLRGVRKTFGRTVAVDGVDLAVASGEFLALLGPSGCGKTTTLRIVAGFERPDAGEVWIRGTSMAAVPPYRRDVGLVFQSYALFPHLSVAENVAYGLRMRRVRGAERTARVEEALALVRLSGLGDRYPRQLSGGQQQRVAVARAIVIRPSVLLFDEPLSNLDARLRLAMREELRELQRTLRIATILVTHDQEEALTLADRIVVMNAGRVEQTGTPEEIYERPASRFVTEFIGESNFLPGEIRETEGSDATFAADCGLTFRIGAPPGAGPGRRGAVAIRPEAIVLVDPGGPAILGATVVDATVRTVIYLGAFRKYRVTTAGGHEFRVSRPLDPLDAAGQTFPEGAPVRLAWLPAHCTFEAAEPAGSEAP